MVWTPLLPWPVVLPPDPVWSIGILALDSESMPSSSRHTLRTEPLRGVERNAEAVKEMRTNYKGRFHERSKEKMRQLDVTRSGSVTFSGREECGNRGRRIRERDARGREVDSWTRKRGRRSGVERAWNEAELYQFQVPLVRNRRRMRFLFSGAILHMIQANILRICERFYALSHPIADTWFPAPRLWSKFIIELGWQLMVLPSPDSRDDEASRRRSSSRHLLARPRASLIDCHQFLPFSRFSTQPGCWTGGSRVDQEQPPTAHCPVSGRTISPTFARIKVRFRVGRGRRGAGIGLICSLQLLPLLESHAFDFGFNCFSSS